MTRDLLRRLARLESEPASRGVRYTVSDHPLTEEEWAARFCAGDGHWSDCAVFNEPASPAGKCNCGGLKLGRQSTP